VLLAQKDSKTLAALLLFKFKDRVSVEYAVSDKTYVRLSPNHLLFWEAIKMAYEEGYEIFDFGRTSPYNKSLMDFKRRWGTAIVDLPQLIYPCEKVSCFLDQEKSWRYMSVTWPCKHAPDCLQPVLGNFCYRHLG
jgi:lipid II:glycine glycyltransferase (peptidoglycan interpeptide bridge formation enzyme)